MIVELSIDHFMIML